MNDVILSKVDEIISFIKEMPEYQKYLLLKEEMARNQELVEIIENVKEKQKELVREEALGKDISRLEKELKSLSEVLNSIPLYVEFSYIQNDLNQLFSGITLAIENYINSKTN